MSHPENTFIQSVHRLLPEGRRDPYWMKNNNMYTAGIWDCWYSGPAADLWIEYKFEKLPKRDTTVVPVDLSELQTDWGLQRYEEGRNMAVIVGCKEGGVLLLNRDWERELTKAAFVARLWTRKQLAHWIIQQTTIHL
jgi:hypothetical protein